MVAVTAVALSACSGDSSSTPMGPTGSAPAFSAQLTIVADPAGSKVALTSVSQVRVEVGASAVDPTRLRFSVNYGDNAVSTQAISTHTYESPGTYVISATVTDAAGRSAQVSQPVTVRSLEGTWFHAMNNRRLGRFELRRLVISSQRGRNVEGVLHGPTGTVLPVTGSVAPDRTATLSMGGLATVAGVVPSLVFDRDALFQLRGFTDTDGEELAFRPITDQPVSGIPIARLDVRTDSSGSRAGLLGFTPIRFDATRSEGDGLSYFINFGDGQVAAESVAVHACQRYGALTGQLSVVDRFGRVSTSTTRFGCLTLVEPDGRAPVRGAWENSIINHSAGRLEWRRLRFESQNGASVAGFYTHPEGWETRFTGSLSNENNIRLVLDDGTIQFTGAVMFTGSAYPDSSQFPDPRMVVLMKGGSADGQTLEFRVYGPSSY